MGTGSYLILILSLTCVLADFYNEYECNNALLDRAVLKATSSMPKRGPEKARLWGKLTKMPSVRWAFNFSSWQPTLAEMQLATRCVQREEKDRLGRFVFQNDFKASLIGRLMMRKFACETLNLGYDTVEFLRDDKGKPILPSHDLVKFNVSHQGDFTVLAGDFGDFLLGVDVVKIERSKWQNLSEYFRLMRRTFTENEWVTIKRHEDPLAMFYRHWCLKESYVKAIGVGITINLQDVSFEINSHLLCKTSFVRDTRVFFKGVEQKEWTFEETLLDDDHCVAVACNAKQNESLFEFLSFNDIVTNAVPLLDLDEDYCTRFFDKRNK